MLPFTPSRKISRKRACLVGTPYVASATAVSAASVNTDPQAGLAHPRVLIWPDTIADVVEYKSIDRMQAVKREEERRPVPRDFSLKGINDWLLDWEAGREPLSVVDHAELHPDGETSDGTKKQLLPDDTKKDTVGIVHSRPYLFTTEDYLKWSKLAHVDEVTLTIPTPAWQCSRRTTLFGRQSYGEDMRWILTPLNICLVACFLVALPLFWLARYCRPGAIAESRLKRIDKVSRMETELSTKMNELEIVCMQIARLHAASDSSVLSGSRDDGSVSFFNEKPQSVDSQSALRSIVDIKLQAQTQAAALEREIARLDRALQQSSEPSWRKRHAQRIQDRQLLSSRLVYVVSALLAVYTTSITIASLSIAALQRCNSIPPSSEAKIVLEREWTFFAIFAILVPVLSMLDASLTCRQLWRSRLSRASDASPDAHQRQAPQPALAAEAATCPPGPRVVHPPRAHVAALPRLSIASVASYETADVSPTDISPGRRARLQSDVPSVVSPKMTVDEEMFV